MRSLTEYRATLERIGGGTVSVDFVREILDAAEAEIDARAGEYTLTQAVEVSGRSRSWFERRLSVLEGDGLARQLEPSGLWLLKGAAIPARGEIGAGFDPSLEVEDLATRALAS